MATLEPPSSPFVDYDAVRRDGFTIVRGMFSPDLCSRLRTACDAAIGASGSAPMEMSPLPTAKNSRANTRETGPQEEVELALATRTSVVDSENWRHTARQPIFDGCLAEAAVAGNMVEMHRKLLRADRGLRLMQQMLVRTDPDPEAVALGYSEPGGWHMDTAFLPRHYTTTPQTNVYHVLTALNAVPSGGAAFQVVPAAFAQSKDYTTAHIAELGSLKDSDFRTVLRPRLLSEAVRDTSQSLEILLGEGDSCVFDLMTTHSASSNCIAGYSRYVIFQTFFDISASYALLPVRGASALPQKFPPEFRGALPQELHYLLEWEYPADEGEKKGAFWGLSREQLEERAAGGGVQGRDIHAAFRRARPAKL